MQRMFKNWRSYSKSHMNAKKFLRCTMKGFDHNQKKLYFSTWSQTIHEEVKTERRKKKIIMQEEIIENQVESGNLQSRHTKLNKTVVRSSNKRTNLSRKTLAKTVARFRRYHEYAAFLKWRRVVVDFKETNAKIKYSMMQRLLMRRLYESFRTWRHNMKREIKLTTKRQIGEETIKIKLMTEAINSAPEQYV